MKPTEQRWFGEKDIEPWAGGKGIRVEPHEIIQSPLWWHTKGLSQTSSGYGRKLVTSGMVLFNGKLRRIYATCYSNAASCWIIVNKEKVFII